MDAIDKRKKPRKPKRLLRNLAIKEVSLVDTPACVDSSFAVLRKRDEQPDLLAAASEFAAAASVLSARMQSLQVKVDCAILASRLEAMEHGAAMLEASR